jgi:16S rRNA (cytosine1402-N4)-methyltransferase
VRIVHANFRDLQAAAAQAGWESADGILMDLGLSSPQLGGPARGFAFSRDEALDMRFDQSTGPTAADYLAAAAAEELEHTLRVYGEEPQARRIAAAIIAARESQPLTTTAQLAEIIARASGGRRGHIHPATRSFQALRMLVNDELGALAAALPQASALLRHGGRLAIIAFHSLEDRMVKQFMRDRVGYRRPDVPRDLPIPPQVGPAPEFRIVTAHPVRPTPAEVQSNPRSRSARLRVLERC